MRFQHKINLLLLGPIVLVLLIIMMSAIPAVVVNVTDWNERIQKHMVSEEEANLLTRAKIMGAVVTTTFKRVSNDMVLAARYAAQIQDMPIRAPYRKFYGGTPEYPPTPTSDWSVWYNHNDRDPNQHPLNETTHIDNIFRPLKRASNKYAAIYLGNDNGLMYWHDWFDQSDFPTFQYTCLRDNRATVGYDPTCRSWYIDADANPGTVVYSPPYEDVSTGSILISPSVTIDSGVLSGVSGVIGGDILMTTLEEELLSNKILRNGYTILGDSAGNAVVYPDMDREVVYKISNLEFTEDVSERSKFETAYAGIFSNSQTTGQFEFTKTSTLEEGSDSEKTKPESREWVASYSKVNGTDYTVVMVVPKSDITFATDEIQASSTAGIIVGVVMLCAIVVVMIISALFINRKIAHRVTAPFKRATAYTKDIGDGKLDAEMGETDEYGHEAPEFAALHDLLTQLMNAVRFSNAAYLNKDSERAIEVLGNVEKLMEKHNNKVGLGVVYNNMAVCHQALGNFAKAKNYLDMAMQNALDLTAKYKKKGDTTAKSLYRIKLAERTMNYGRYYSALDDIESAEQQFNNAIKIHLEEDNTLGLVQVEVNWGALFMKKGKKGRSIYDPATAFTHYANAFNTACARHQRKKNAKNIEALQYATVHLGMYHMEIQQYPHAMQMLQFAMTLSKKMDRSLHDPCLVKLADIYALFGDHARASQLRKDLNISKHITFILDCSGSMRGMDGGHISRIDACRAAISTILNEQMFGDDTASMITFNEGVRKVFDRKNVDKHRSALLYDVAHNTDPTGPTAFYDAVQQAIDQAPESDMARYFIALTDGADNRSDRAGVTPGTLIRCVKRNQPNLIVITVGEISSATMDTIDSVTTEAARHGVGICIPAKDAGKIQKSFTKAMAQIDAQANLEQL